MYCPKCKSEYTNGTGKCPKCGSELVELPCDGEKGDYVTIAEIADKAQLAVVKSVLEGSGIPFQVFGEVLQDVIALGGLGYNPIIGPVRIVVPQSCAEDAAKLLEALDSEELPEEEWYPGEDPEEDGEEEQ